MSSPGFAFANPQPSPDNFDEFDPQDVYADSGIQATPITEAIPPSWKTLPVMSLSEVLGASAVAEIQKSKQIVFHAVGDTGGVKEPSHEFAVADAMTGDLGGKTYQSGRPALLYHLGDVVYYFGQERYYYDQFYDPYRDYDAPIFAIPGNHDGVIFPSEPVKYSLEPFYNNFCSQAPAHDPATAATLLVRWREAAREWRIASPNSEMASFHERVRKSGVRFPRFDLRPV
jgi:hypothetical protein